MSLGTLASVMHHGSVTIALPTIARHFDTDLATVQWVVIAEALTISALLLPIGRLADMLGRKRVYIAGILVFTVGSALAGMSDLITVLIIFKVVQGLGAAMSQGTALAMITPTFPSTERGKGLGTHASVVGAGGVIGPVMGGLLVSAVGWRWVFFINVPLGILAAISALLIMDSRLMRQQQNQRLAYDWLGAVLSTAFLVTFLLTVTNGSKVGWTSPTIVVAALTFLVFLSIFIWWELRAPTPMLDLRLFSRWVFSIGVSSAFISFLGVSSSRFLLPFYLQAALGYSPAQIGLIMIPNAISRIVMGPISGRLSDRYGWKIFTVLGMGLSGIGLFMLAAVTVTSSLTLVIIAIVVQSSGSGIFSSPNSSAIFSAAEEEKHGVISALLSLVRNSGNVTGIAIAAAIVTAVMISMGQIADIGGVIGAGRGSEVVKAFSIGLRTTFAVMGSLALLAAFASMFKTQKVQEELRTSEPVRQK